MSSIDYRAEIDDLRARISVLEKGVDTYAESNADDSTV